MTSAQVPPGGPDGQEQPAAEFSHPAFESRPQTREQAQLNLILEEFRGEVDVGPSNWEEVGVRYLYRSNRLLVRDEYLTRVTGLLVRQLGPFPRPEPAADETSEQGPEPEARPADPPRLVEPPLDAREPVILGVTALTLPGAAGQVSALTALDWVRDVYGGGVAALDHLLHIAMPAGTCPATEPSPMPSGAAPDPGHTTDRGAGEGVRVVVIDTGLDPGAPGRHGWLAGVTGDQDPKIVGGQLRPYAGHGTFVAGIVRSVAPRAEVIVRSIFQRSGAEFETKVLAALEDVLRDDAPDIISMSAGTYADDSTGMLAFQLFNENLLRHHKGVALVVAAGNDTTRERFWPAAATYAVSVGALTTYRRGRAGFSNFGGWVDVYAPGQDLVNAFPVGEYTYQEPPDAGRVQQFHGMARWSGTSFATPVVSGLIAARMSRTGENGRDAAAALLAIARAGAQPGVGAVLLPD